MSRRMISFDLDKAITFLGKLSEEAPNLIQMAEAQGLNVPPSLSKYAPWAGIAAQLAGKLYPRDRDGGLSRPGLPDTGPLGRGRLSYLRRKKSYEDSRVVDAVATILSPESGLPGAASVSDMVEYTLSLLYPDISNYSSTQKRVAVDQFLEFDGMGQGAADKLGDMLWHLLNLPPPTPPPKEEGEG